MLPWCSLADDTLHAIDVDFFHALQLVGLKLSLTLLVGESTCPQSTDQPERQGKCHTTKQNGPSAGIDEVLGIGGEYGVLS
jgi:hypothetical protein